MFFAIVHAPRCTIVDPNDECIGVKWWHDHYLNPRGITCLHCLHNWWISNELFWFKSLSWMVTFAFCSKQDDLHWKTQHPWESEVLEAMKICCGFAPTVRKTLKTMGQRFSTKQQSAMWQLGKSYMSKECLHAWITAFIFSLSIHFDLHSDLYFHHFSFIWIMFLFFFILIDLFIFDMITFIWNCFLNLSFNYLCKLFPTLIYIFLWIFIN